MLEKQSKNSELVIQGITKDGRKFRPSDWAERMSGMLSTFSKNHRIHYSNKLRPVSIDGTKCIILDKSLADSHPEIYHQIMEFAAKNELTVRPLNEI